MKKIDVGQMIQILANIGVIAGIVFLGVELQQNSAGLGVQARLEREDVRRRAAERRLDNDRLIVAWVKSAEGVALTPEEVFLIDIENGLSFVDWMFVYMQVRDGLLDETAIPLDAWREQFELPYRRMRESWVGSEHRYAPEFVQFVRENILGDATLGPSE